LFLVLGLGFRVQGSKVQRFRVLRYRIQDARYEMEDAGYAGRKYSSHAGVLTINE
jgi:hypothetical protein